MVGGIAVTLIIAYTLFVSSPYLLGPTLDVISPSDESTLSSPLVTITGKTSRVAYLSLNDQPIPLLEDGAFAVERSYPAGYTVIVLRARDRFGREEVKTIRFLTTYNPPPHGIQKENDRTESANKSN